MPVPERVPHDDGFPAQKTRIVATIGPASASVETLQRMIRAGVSVCRLNFAHGDFDSHGATIAMIREAARATGRRVRAVLQPHRWVRTARHWPALADAAALADEVLVLDVYGAGERAIPGVSSERIAARLRDGGHRAECHDLASAEHYLAGTLAPGDLVITLGAGDVWRVAQALVEHEGRTPGTLAPEGS